MNIGVSACVSRIGLARNMSTDTIWAKRLVPTHARSACDKYKALPQDAGVSEVSRIS
jgi:hypothetical protein